MAFVKYVGKSDFEKYKDADSYRDVITYCVNSKKMVCVGSVNISNIQTAAEEMELVESNARKSSGKKLCHIVISFHKSELQNYSLDTLCQIATKSALYFSEKYQVVYAVHLSDAPHVHLVVNRISCIDYKRYLNRYDDQDAFWHYLHGILADYNIRLWKNR